MSLTANNYLEEFHAHYQTGRLQEALANMEMAVWLDPEQADSWYKYGVLLSRLVYAEKAIAAYDQAITLAPQFAPAWNDKGGALNGLGRHEEAIDEIIKGVILSGAFGTRVGYSVLTMMENEDRELFKILASIASTSAGISASVISQYLQAKIWNQKVPEFQEFKEEFLAYAMDMKVRMGALQEEEEGIIG